MPGAPTAAGFGAALILAGLGFGSPSLLVPGIGLLGLGGRRRRLGRAGDAVAAGARARARRGWSRTSPSGCGSTRRRRPPAAARRRAHRSGARRSRCASGRAGSGSVDAEVRLRGRGRRRLEPARLGGPRPARPAHADGRLATTAGELLVLPRIDPVVVAGRGAGGRRARSPGSRTGAAPGRLDARAIELEVDGLRAYREGSPASRIHWPAVARTGELIERRLVAGADSGAAGRPRRLAARPSAEALDAAVRAAGSLCWHLAQAGRLRDPAARATGARPRSSRSCAAGRRCTPAWRWSSRARAAAGARAARSAPAPCSGSPRAPARRCPRRFATASGPRYLVGPVGRRPRDRRRSWSPAARAGGSAPAAPRRRGGRRERRRGPRRGARRRRRSRAAPPGGAAQPPTRAGCRC